MPEPVFYIVGLFSSLIKYSSFYSYGNILVISSKSCIFIIYSYSLIVETSASSFITYAASSSYLLPSESCVYPIISSYVSLLGLLLSDPSDIKKPLGWSSYMSSSSITSSTISSMSSISKFS